jgi:hypothetical protein
VTLNVTVDDQLRLVGQLYSIARDVIDEAVAESDYDPVLPIVDKESILLIRFGRNRLTKLQQGFGACNIVPPTYVPLHAKNCTLNCKIMFYRSFFGLILSTF